MLHYIILYCVILCSLSIERDAPTASTSPPSTAPEAVRVIIR